MRIHTKLYKRAGMAAIFSFLLLGSINVSAQKSVYDVIPGSGPKKQRPIAKKTSLPDIVLGDKRNRDDDNEGDDDRVANRNRRTHLPPGQAKKVYGGSAKDYAPGQLKKKKHGHGRKHHKHNKHDND